MITTINSKNELSNTKNIMVFISFILMMLICKSINAESNVNTQVILDKKALINFAKSNKDTKKSGDKIKTLLSTVGDMWIKYDSSQESESTKVELAGKMTKTIAKLITKNQQWDRALIHEKSMVHNLLDSSKEMPRTKTTIKSLDSKTRRYAKGLLDKYTRSLSPADARITSAVGQWSVTSGFWQERITRDGRRPSAGSANGVYTRQDMVDKLNSLDESRKVSHFMEQTFASMLLVLDGHIKDGALSGMAENQGFIDVAKVFQVSGKNVITPPGSHKEDKAFVHFNAYD